VCLSTVGSAVELGGGPDARMLKSLVTAPRLQNSSKGRCATGHHGNHPDLERSWSSPGPSDALLDIRTDAR
jgi:hypothetical protein